MRPRPATDAAAARDPARRDGPRERRAPRGPEGDASAHAPIRLTGATRVAELLARTGRGGHVLVIPGPDGRRHNSAVLRCAAEPPGLEVDEPPDGWPDDAEPLTFSLRPDGVEIRFVARLDARTGAVALPEALEIREQRADFRARVGYDDAVPVRLGDLEGRLRNLSVCGFGAWFASRDAEALKVTLAAAEAVACGLGFRDAAVGTLRGHVRHVDDAGPPGVRVGVEFDAPPPEAVRALRRWSMELEREALRRRRDFEER